MKAMKAVRIKKPKKPKISKGMPGVAKLGGAIKAKPIKAAPTASVSGPSRGRKRKGEMF